MHRGTIWRRRSELRPPLTSTPLNQASIWRYYTSIIYGPSRYHVAFVCSFSLPSTLSAVSLYRKHLAEKYTYSRSAIWLRYGSDTARALNPTLQTESQICALPGYKPLNGNLSSSTRQSYKQLSSLSSRNLVTGTEWGQNTLK